MNRLPVATRNHSQAAANPGKPKSSGYAEPKPDQSNERDKPNPAVAGDEASQIAPTEPDDVESPGRPAPVSPEPSDDDAGEETPGNAGGNIEYPDHSSPPGSSIESVSDGGTNPSEDIEYPTDNTPVD